MSEVWKAVVDSNGKYEVSSLGQVRNTKTGRILHQFVGKDGYYRTQLGGTIGKSVTVHRLVCKAFVPKINGKDFVNHKDGNKQNNRVDNLEWCTRSENMYHAYEHSLKETPLGMKNGRCKLSYSDIDFILKHYIPRDKVYGAKPLAELFGVAPQTICAVTSGQNWRMSHCE